VLSRVDGTSSENAIASATGLELDQVRRALSVLSEVGAIAYEHEGPAPASPPEADTDAPPDRPPDALDLLFDEELSEAVDLSGELKRTILKAFHAAEGLSLYELFRVPETADKKEIKRAYYEQVNQFHPDRYFGKSLGSYRSMLEKIFARATEAHDTLTRTSTRKEYDAYLASRRQTDSVHQLLETPVQEAQSIQDQIMQDLATGSDPPEVVVPKDVEASVEPIRPTRPGPAIRRPSDPRIRQKALARKLRGVSGQMPRASISPPVSGEELREQAGDALKSLYEARLGRAVSEQVERYTQSADEAESRKDPLSALNALKIAAELDPDNEVLKGRLGATEKRVMATLSGQQLEQARYEEREGQFARAAENYQRAANTKNDPALFAKAAECLLKADGDLRIASENSRKAVSLAPEKAHYRVILARIYAQANMRQSAIKEIERAKSLAPQDERVLEWVKRIKRGEAS
jgi:curved DNA-binding protein CbpA